jgi:ubiquinone/menaquinone biosynthesis C-methylase UbiE
MTNVLVPGAPEMIEIRTLSDLVSLYQSRLNDLSITSYSEMMLMTEYYQAQSFAMVTELIGNLSKCESVVEIGCGCGCLLAYLRAHGFRGEYLGIDLVAGFIEKAQARFAGDNAARFMVGNFLEMQEDDLPKHDYYVATSIFGFIPEGSFMREIVKKACRLAEKGVVITCNSTDHQVLPLKARMYSPADVLSICLEFGMSIDFKHRCVPIEDSHYAMIGALINTGA